MARSDYDVIAAEVHRKALENLTHEMAITLVRTSGSPIVTDAGDFSTCLMDTKPEHLGFASYVLFHVGSSLIGTQVITSLVEAADVRPGDGWVVNDPHTGGAMHQGDVSIIMPTFYKDELLGWSFSNMHVLDIGGVGISGYAPGAHDVYQEGLRFPPVRIIRGGGIDIEWEQFIAANVRAPGPVLNDIRSMIAANNTATRKLGEIVDEFGLEGRREYCEINKDLSEQVLRERIAKIPDGVYEATDWNEFDGHDGPDLLLKLGCRLEVDGTELRFRYSGVPQIDAFVNSTEGPMFGQTMTALMTSLVYGDLPINGGLWRPITLDLGEPGTIVNSVPPAPVSNAHSEVGMRACKLAKAVLNQALALSDDPVLQGRVAGQCQDGFPGSALFGANQHGGTSVIFYIDNASGSGGGAQTIGDGQDSYGLTCMTGCGLADVEVHEAADPVFFLWRKLIPNSGGPGQTRGGQALEQAFAIHYTDAMGGPGFNACAEIPPIGFGGGYPASSGDFHPLTDTNIAALVQRGLLPTEARLEGTRVATRSKLTHLVLARDDVFITTSGGGGLGDPLLRAPALVAVDLAAGYITPGHARAAYGVIVRADGHIDDAASSLRREEIRRERIGATPSAELRGPASVGISVVHDGNDWACGSCGAALSDIEQNWREGEVALVERPITERFAELEMRVRHRTEAPRVTLREYSCQSCAASLAVEVATEGLAALAAPVLLVGADVPG